jgi:hypothetical protein
MNRRQLRSRCHAVAPSSGVPCGSLSGNVAIEHLVRRRLELPGYSTLDRMVARVRAEVNEGVFRNADIRHPGRKAPWPLSLVFRSHLVQGRLLSREGR